MDPSDSKNSENQKLKTQNAILKKAVVQEQQKTSQLEKEKEDLSNELQERSKELRAALEEIDTLQFNNQRLTKRVELLQDEFTNNKSPGKTAWRFGTGGELAKKGEELNILRNEFQEKIAESERLHMLIMESKLEHEQTVTVLNEKISALKLCVQAQQNEIDKETENSKARIFVLDTTNSSFREQSEKIREISNKVETELKERIVKIRDLNESVRKVLEVSLGTSVESYISTKSLMFEKSPKNLNIDDTNTSTSILALKESLRTQGLGLFRKISFIFSSFWKNLENNVPINDEEIGTDSPRNVDKIYQQITQFDKLTENLLASWIDGNLNDFNKRLEDYLVCTKELFKFLTEPEKEEYQENLVQSLEDLVSAIKVYAPKLFLVSNSSSPSSSSPLLVSKLGNGDVTESVEKVAKHLQEIIKVVGYVITEQPELINSLKKLREVIIESCIEDIPRISFSSLFSCLSTLSSTIVESQKLGTLIVAHVEQRADEVKALKEKMQGLLTDTEKMKDELYKRAQTNEKLTSDIDGLNVLNEQLNQEIATWKQRSEGLQNRLQETITQNDAYLKKLEIEHTTFVENLVKENNQKIETLTKENKEKVENLLTGFQTKMEATIKFHENKNLELEKSHESKVKQLNSETEEKIKEHERKIASITESHTNEIVRLKTDMNLLATGHSEELARCNKDLEDTFANHNKQIAELQNINSLQIQALQNDVTTLQEKIENNNQEHLAKIAELNAQAEEKEKNLQYRHEKNIKEITAAHQEEIAKIATQHKSEVDAIKNELQELKNQHELLIQQSKTLQEDLQSQISDLQSSLELQSEEHQTQQQELQEQFDQQALKFNMLKQSYSNSQKQIQQSQAELSQTKEMHSNVVNNYEKRMSLVSREYQKRIQDLKQEMENAKVSSFKEKRKMEKQINSLKLKIEKLESNKPQNEGETTNGENVDTTNNTTNENENEKEKENENEDDENENLNPENEQNPENTEKVEKSAKIEIDISDDLFDPFASTNNTQNNSTQNHSTSDALLLENLPSNKDTPIDTASSPTTTFPDLDFLSQPQIATDKASTENPTPTSSLIDFEENSAIFVPTTSAPAQDTRTSENKYKLIVMSPDGTIGDSLGLNPMDRERENEIKHFYESKVSQYEAQASLANSKVLKLFEEFEEASHTLEKLKQEKEELGSKLSSAQQTLQASKEDLDLTRTNYDAQIQILSDHIVQLNDSISKQEVEIHEMRKCKVLCGKCKAWNPVEYLINEGKFGQRCVKGNHQLQTFMA